MGHKHAKAELAWAHLLGHSVELDIYKHVFVDLAESGLSEAHMVKLVYKKYYFSVK